MKIESVVDFVLSSVPQLVSGADFGYVFPVSLFSVVTRKFDGILKQIPFNGFRHDGNNPFNLAFLHSYILTYLNS